MGKGAARAFPDPWDLGPRAPGFKCAASSRRDAAAGGWCGPWGAADGETEACMSGAFHRVPYSQFQPQSGPAAVDRTALASCGAQQPRVPASGQAWETDPQALD